VEKCGIFLTANFLSNISAKYYENPIVPLRVIAKNIVDGFLTHCVVLNVCSERQKG